MSRYHNFTFYVLLSLIALPAAICFAQSPNINEGMRDASQAVNTLFSYAWDVERFNDPKNKVQIEKLLNRLSKDFHSIERAADNRSKEPGFSIILKAQQEMLEDISTRFASGKTEYARWRLRGVLQNCATCHARLPTKLDFTVGQDLPPPKTIKERFLHAQLLFSSRQFDGALLILDSLAKELSQDSATAILAMNALKQWLLIQVRVKSEWRVSASRVDKLAAAPGFSESQKELLQEWARDLNKLESKKVGSSFKEAKAYIETLLQPVIEADSIPEQEQHLVSTLRASGMLHEQLSKNLSELERRQLLYLLGVSYAKLPIVSLESFARLYLERCIREHPGTVEAQKSYELYSKLLLLESSGSGGIHLEAEDEELLATLLELAGQRKSL